MKIQIILRTGIAAALLIAALTFIQSAVKSWISSPSVTSGRIQFMITIMISNDKYLLSYSQLQKH